MSPKSPKTGRSLVSRRWVLAALCASGAWACGSGDDPAGGAGAGPKAAVVEIQTLEPSLLRDVVHIPGQLAAEASVVLKTEVEGVLEAIDFAEGASVEDGQVLLRLRDDEQRARLQEARAELALAEAVYARTGRLVERDVASAAELERVAAERDVAAARVVRARVELDRMKIRAPFPGVMGALHVAPGERLREQTELTQIDSIDRLQLLFSLPEIAVGLVRVGAPVQLRVAPYPGVLFHGEIYFVSPSVDPEGRRLLVKAWVPNADHQLRPGLFAQIEAEIERRPDALLVPESALVYGLEGTTVWRVDGDGRAHAVPVELGVRQDGRVEIRSGLAPGDRVVTAGVHKVSPGGLVRGSAPPASGPPASDALAEDGPARDSRAEPRAESREAGSGEGAS